MGGSSSKSEKTDALRLCKARKRFIKQAIDSRYAFAAAHFSYIESLRTIGIALRRFAEAEVLVEPTANEPDKTPSHSSLPSPEVFDSPLPNGSPQVVSRLSYMRSGGTSAVTVRVNPSSNSNNSNNSYFHDGGESYTMPPPPPPPPEPGHSWDYFDPIDDAESFRFMRDNDLHVGFDDMGLDTHELDHKVHDKAKMRKLDEKGDTNSSNLEAQGGAGDERNLSVAKAAAESSSSKKDKSIVKKDLSAEREDPSEFITHRAKDFLSSIKDIEHRFFRASESGKEVSRMLEVNNIRVGYSDAKGGSSGSDLLAALHLVCCQGKTSLVSHEPSDGVTKVITWKRSTSSRSSSSRNPLASASKDDNDDSGSDFAEEFCMIAGIHSSTLERLYAWERKLYDEVKASESIRKEYDRKCDQLRHQFAKDLSAHVIDKTRAVVKDLHSRIRVALQSVDSISKRIEKIRDDELQPQLIELIQGLIRMWKAMLECHHAQYITISLAYHAKRSTSTLQGGDIQKEIMAQLEDEIECFGLSFANWINNHTSYVEALNGWLQNCILQPQERVKGRRAFSPRRVLAPPIIVLGRDWSAGIKDLPSEELSNAIKDFLGDLRHLVGQKGEEMQQKEKASGSSNNGESESKDEEEENVDRPSNLTCVKTSLGKVLDRLTKFSEASLKMYEDIRQKSETARNAYSNYRVPRYQR